MKLVCPECDAHYDVPDEAIPAEGREVRCAACEHVWFVKHSTATSQPENVNEPFEGVIEYRPRSDYDDQDEGVTASLDQDNVEELDTSTTAEDEEAQESIIEELVPSELVEGDSVDTEEEGEISSASLDQEGQIEAIKTAMAAEEEASKVGVADDVIASWEAEESENPEVDLEAPSQTAADTDPEDIISVWEKAEEADTQDDPVVEPVLEASYKTQDTDDFEPVAPAVPDDIEQGPFFANFEDVDADEESDSNEVDDENAAEDPDIEEQDPAVEVSEDQVEPEPLLEEDHESEDDDTINIDPEDVIAAAEPVRNVGVAAGWVVLALFVVLLSGAFFMAPDRVTAIWPAASVIYDLIAL